MANLMMDFAKTGDIEKMRELEKIGVAYGVKNAHGSAAIHFAAQNGQSKCLEFLVEQGVPTDEPGSGGATPLQFAVRTDDYTKPENKAGKAECAKILILRCTAKLTQANEYAFAAENSLLDLAVARDQVDVNDCAMKLVNYGSFNTTVEQRAAHYKAIKSLLKHDDINISKAAVQWTIQKDEISLFRRFVFGHGASADATACDEARKMFSTNAGMLWSMCFNSRIEFLKIALDNGGVLLINSKSGISQDMTTMLQDAAYRGQTDVVDLLLMRGADVWITSEINRSALHFAAHYNNVEIGKTLLAHARPRISEFIDMRDLLGQTALHIAAKKRSYMMISMLILNGADKTIKDNAGRTAHDLLGYDELLTQAHRSLDCEPPNFELEANILRLAMANLGKQ